MKTFTDLINEVQKPGLCHRCGGCVTFCTAINYGALELDAEGKPRYAIRPNVSNAACVIPSARKLMSWMPKPAKARDGPRPSGA